MSDQGYVEISSKNIDAFYLTIREYKRIIRRARRNALASAGKDIRKEINEFIKAGGENWPDPHPATEQGIQGKRRRRRRYRGPMRFLESLHSQRLERYGSRLRVYFPRKRHRLLNWLVRTTQTGGKVNVSDRMRRLFGSARRRDRDEPGEDFFPLRGETDHLEIPARPIITPVFRRERNRILQRFAENFEKNLKKQEKRL